MIIAPSILSADWSKLQQELQSCNACQIQHLHFDVMDGHFVPPITFGDKLVADIRVYSTAFFDVHLMVDTPSQYFKDMISAGADAITFHIESTRYSYRLISQIKKINNNTKVGIALNPQTPMSSIFPIIDQVDIVLLMGVEPGFGGQAFIPDVLQKIAECRDYKHAHQSKFMISIDGGVNKNTAQKILEHGADILVMGSAFFGEKDRKQLISDIKTLG